MIRTKDDVEVHSDGFRPARPAVNVKVYSSLNSVKLPLDLGSWRKVDEEEWHNAETEVGFTHEWVEENVSPDELMGVEQFVLEDAWSELNNYAQSIWGTLVRVEQEGRSGGWATVSGINQDIDSWDAIELGRWRKFANYAEQLTRDIPWQMMNSIYHNIYLMDT